MMVRRAVAIVIGSLVLVASGVAHGLWTDRWGQSEALEQAVERLGALPDDLGPWKGTAYEQDPAMLALAGASGHYSRSFLDPETGDRVIVVLLVGRANRMAVHRPEHCYQASGYLMNGPPVKVNVRAGAVEPAEFFAGAFSRDDAGGPTQLQIFWSFSAGGRWEAPDSPRTRFARDRVLYKLYVIRTVAGSPGRLDDDPATRLLGRLLPALEDTLGAGR